jgi:hypothetical protein
VFADEPSLVRWQMLLSLVPDPLRWSVALSNAVLAAQAFQHNADLNATKSISDLPATR